ncbi:tudor domain-containing 6 [Scomber japonicus]|uniref:tudor domain-containing 6 n=1 Tax=Scomber japonicus TaxID=13676 RepID=UPI0023069706|nr:tudor domain-containing 6 [Scomber japonicus]
MCSIPGLPTPGSDVPVLITRVNPNPNCGLVELWVHMGDGGKHVYEKLKEEIQIPKGKFCGSEGKPGDLCLVCISDTWHRARILSIQSETFNVFLIDQGQHHSTTSEALAWGQSDSFLLPPEIESCILANVISLENIWPEKATTFLKSLPGKKFKGLVQHVLMPDRIILLDIPVVSNHICKFGIAKKIPVEEFKCLVLKCLHLPKGDASEACHVTQEQSLNVMLEKHDQYLYPELLTDTFETVTVTEVVDPQKFFCKLHIFSKTVKILSEQIHQHYEETSDFGEAQPQTNGDPCAAKGSNGRWCRSLLKQNIVTSDAVEAVEVLHVDEGKTESVPVGDIKPLLGKFLRMPVVTYLCSLDGVNDNGTGWTTNQTDYLKSLLLNETVVAGFNHHSKPQDVYSVTLYAANAECINNCFLVNAESFPPCKTEQDSNVQNHSIPSSCLSSFVDELCVDLQNTVSLNVDALEETMPSTKNTPVNGGEDETQTSGPTAHPLKVNSEHPDPLIHENGHLSTCCSSEVQDAHRDMFTERSSANVKVSCIQKLQKIWCQATENADSLSLLMENLQTHYASAQLQPLVQSICVARNPETGMWCRARIIASHHSPVVDVKFIDYDQTEKVPLRDVYPIDPAFLDGVNGLFQCCLFNLKNGTNSNVVTSGASSNGVLKSNLKARTSNEESPSLSQKCSQVESQVLSLVPSNAYNYSTHDIEVGGKEKVCITSSENVNHFYCQLDRNSHLLDKVMENVKQLICQPQCTDCQLGLNSVCLARYTDNQWYRGQVIEMSPKLKVHFVDYGDTLAVSESDICAFSSEACIAMSVPVQAVPLGLFDVPAAVPQEVNQWFEDNAIGRNFTISVVAKGERGKLIVELFEGSLNVNGKVRECIAKMKQKTNGRVKQTDQQCCKGSQQASAPGVDELTNVPPLEDMTEKSKVCSNGICSSDELKMDSQSTNLISIPKVEHGRTLDEGRKPTLDVKDKKETMVAQTFIQGLQTDSEMAQLCLPSCPDAMENIYMYKWPNISQNKTEEVYASCIVGPNYFWCQCANTENLDIVSRVAQEVGQAQQDTKFPKTLDSGSPCLALFYSDNKWYRAQVIQRTGNTLNVLFVDYGNESEVDIKDVRTVPQSLLELAPQAFLCTLNGFDESKGSWDDSTYDYFYNLLADKPLRVTVLHMKDKSESGVPQYAVKTEWEDVVVNSMIQKYWKPFPTEHGKKEIVTEIEMATSLQGIQIESNMAQLKENVTTSAYKKSNISKNKEEEVYASCIVEPGFFWCQYANTEDLCKVVRLAQEAGQAEQDVMFSETLSPGSPCLALFSSDNQWYRAQVIHRSSDTFNVLFVDYGNESDVDIKNVRSVPHSLLELAPQAFLCSLNGFEESKGSWDDTVHDYFYNLLVDKPLKVSVLNMEDYSEIAVSQYAVDIECQGVNVNAAMQVYWKPVAKEHVMTESPETETFLQDGKTESNIKHTVSKENVSTCMYKKPNISKNKEEEVYASCIVEPSFFWCQYANTEDLCKVVRLAQEAGQAEQDVMFSETLSPGSPCLALFSSDNQWYRAQVIHRSNNTFNVLFVDYGNESDVDIKNVRSVPHSLLELAPQAFLCSLNGFEKSKGSWDDNTYDHFYNRLVDKPLKVSVFNMEVHSEISFPQYAVEIVCEGVNINAAMQVYWKPVAKEHVMTESPETETILQDGKTESNIKHTVSKENVNTYRHKKPNISKNKEEEVYASCIVEPSFFWCQYANTEDFCKVVRLAQEAGQAEQDVMFSETLSPGSPCLALFSSDNQWYRAQVIRRSNDTFNVLFVDYGNESDVDIKNVRSVPHSLLELAPQAFLCSLNGFEESKGSWDDKVYDDFYNLLVDKPLKVSVLNMEVNSEIAFPQYAVEIECEGVVVNTVMEKYWKGFPTDHTFAESPDSG